MPDQTTAGDVGDLFATAVRRTRDEAGYGSWRSISAPDAVSLSFGFPYSESFPTDELLAAVETVFAEEGDRALQYGGGEYSERLPGVVAERCRDRGIDCADDDVLLMNGSTHALDSVCKTFLDPGDAMFVESPTFMGALSLFRNYDADITGFPVDENGLDVDAVADELRDRRASGEPTPKLLYTIPNFQNPTGTTLSRERRERLLDLAAEFDFVVLEDDAYGQLRYDGGDVQPLAALDDAGRVVHVGTFSKTIAPGVRTGWVVADEPVREQVRRMAAGGTNVFTQSVLGCYCTEGHLEANLREFREAYETRRDHMLDSLATHMPASAEWTEPEGGFFVWVTLPGVDTDAMLEDAAEEGVTYLPGELFYPDDGASDGLRISFSHASLTEMDEGVAALARAASDALE